MPQNMSIKNSELKYKNSQEAIDIFEQNILDVKAQFNTAFSR